MNKLLCILIIGIIGSSCNPSVKENPLKILEKGLWVPMLEDPFSYQITRRFVDAPDSTFVYEIPCWIIGSNKQVITERTTLNHCSDYKLAFNKDGEWEIERYGCRIKTSEEKDQLVCLYRDASGKIHEIKYRHCLKESSLSLEQFWALDNELKNTLWREVSGGGQKKYYVFTADVGIENKPDSHQKIYKYPIVLDSMHQQLSEDRSEFKNLEFLFNNKLVFLYFEDEKSVLYILDRQEENQLKLLKVGQEDIAVTWTIEKNKPPVMDTLIHRFNTLKTFN